MISSTQIQSYAQLPSSLAFREEQARLFLRKADIELSDQQLATLRECRRAACLQNLPAVKDLCRSFFKSDLHIAPLPEKGTFYGVYHITIEPNRCYYLRANFLLHTPAFAFLFDAWAENFLSQEVPTASILAIELNRNRPPSDYMLSLSTSGKTLKQLENPQTQALDATLLLALGQTVAKIHAVLGTNYGPLDISSWQHTLQVPQGTHTSWSEYLLLHLETHIKRCSEAGVLSTEEATLCSRFLQKEACGVFESAPSHLLHGDLGHHNIMTDGQQITAILDWEDVLCGDPVFDIASWGTFNREEMREPFLRGYASIRPLPQDFEWRYWLYYLRIALAKTVHRLRFHISDPPNRPPAHLRIHRALEHLKRLS
ncbi:putative homoserine kinase type II (protein kinase fold) [Chthonomonas calidirosea]|uniref:Putative homoserine kinase type II (Protein kinase fold) n=1 Tax=Chthonomonas calidirosea (strain DSM 23976 / ICMP 18418 / T49) TaxID=1303518 RepID=S0EZ52_CHTCT|nr:aminoglycoside phosphotransferase family protein [Chthonomonas calidirosea]CCW35479.1 Putative homoserine kinase type II (protein kinase fold) [Chthonomonas calidirosea T49]CEK20148.1 putative homoserine kinase type II (protein kinase fold) [Chthonomonas calidirosea]